jgi:hypothetical protein
MLCVIERTTGSWIFSFPFNLNSQVFHFVITPRDGVFDEKVRGVGCGGTVFDHSTPQQELLFASPESPPKVSLPPSFCNIFSQSTPGNVDVNIFPSSLILCTSFQLQVLTEIRSWESTQLGDLLPEVMDRVLEYFGGQRGV